MSRQAPESNRQYLYIAVGDFNTINLVDLIEQARDHFGPCEAADLAISPEWTQVEGCSCCYDSSDYVNYICVSLA